MGGLGKIGHRNATASLPDSLLEEMVAAILLVVLKETTAQSNERVTFEISVTYLRLGILDCGLDSHFARWLHNVLAHTPASLSKIELHNRVLQNLDATRDFDASVKQFHFLIGPLFHALGKNSVSFFDPSLQTACSLVPLTYERPCVMKRVPRTALTLSIPHALSPSLTHERPWEMKRAKDNSSCPFSFFWSGSSAFVFPACVSKFNLTKIRVRIRNLALERLYGPETPQKRNGLFSQGGWWG